MTNITSPCIRNCCLDSKDVCTGCLRTLNEILQWSQADDDLKTEILCRVQHRQQQRFINNASS